MVAIWGVLERGWCRTLAGLRSSEVARTEDRLLGAQVAIGGVELADSNAVAAVAKSGP